MFLQPHPQACKIVNKKHIDIVYMFAYHYTMSVEYSLHGIRFEWDSNQSETNLRKHGIAFENACEVFFNPFLWMMESEIHNGQIREAIVGMTINWRLLYVIYSMLKDDIFRIISARPVTKHERKQYEEQ
jgi:uncharacterized DUF497 family protein